MVSIVGLTSGCDDQAAQVAQDRAMLTEASDVYKQANRQYLPEGESKSLTEYRSEKLAAAESSLQSLTTSLDDPVAKSSAQLLLSEVKRDRVRVTVRQTERAFGLVVAQGRALSSQIVKLEHINALITARGGDGASVLAAIDQGEGDVIGLAEMNQKRAAVTSDLSELSTQREAATLNAERYNAEASEHFSRSQQYEQQAFVATTKQNRDTAYRNAYQAQIDGHVAQRSANDAQIEVDRLAEQIAGLRTEVELWDGMATSVDNLKKRVQEDNDNAASDVSRAGGDKSAALTEVRKQFEKIEAEFTQNVAGPLAEAVTRATEAVDLIDKARSSAQGSQRQSLGFDRIAAQVTLTQVLSRQAGYTRDFANLVGAIGENPAIAGSSVATECRTRATRLNNDATSFAEQARKVIGEGLEEADGLAGETEIGRNTAALVEALNSYGSQLN